MKYNKFQNKELENIFPNSHPYDLYNQNHYQYKQNTNNPKNYEPKIQNNLINSEFNYQQDFSHPQVNNEFIPHNNFILNTNNNKPNNNLINNNLIYQNYNQPYNLEQNINYYLDPKRKKQEEYKRMLDQQRLQNLNIKEKKREISNNNFINNNINETTNKYITKPQMTEEDRIKNKNKQKEYRESLKKQIEEKNRRKEMEKKREKEEDLKIEEKIKKLKFEEQLKEENFKNNNY